MNYEGKPYEWSEKYETFEKAKRGCDILNNWNERYGDPRFYEVWNKELTKKFYPYK